MIKLSNATLAALPAAVSVPLYDRSRVSAGIVHLGVGNFHRVHQAIAVEALLEKPGNEVWGILGVGILPGEAGRAKAAAFKAQDCLYTVTEFAADGSSRIAVIGAMVDYLHAPSDPEAVLSRLAAPQTHIVSLTITEGGYDPAKAVSEAGAPGQPVTTFDYIVEGLARRRDAGLAPFTVMSCDNLRGNGDTAQAATLAVARLRGADLAAWIEREVAFPNSMVDRIAPSVKEADRQALNASSSIDDAVPASCEVYTNWVMEDRFSDGRPAFDKVGVSLRGDVAAFVAVKGRLSNAAHMLLAFPAVLIGYRLVNEAMRDARLEKLLRDFWTIDAIPLVTAPPGLSPQIFTNQVIERFANLGINDQLLRVAGDGVSKLLVFHTKNIADLIAAGKPLDRVAFMFACFAHYLRGHDDHGHTFKVDEPQLGEADWQGLERSDPLAVLKLRPFAEMRLMESDAFRERFEHYFNAIATMGTSQVLSDLVGMTG